MSIPDRHLCVRGCATENELDFPFERWLGVLERYVLARLGDRQLAEEIAQEAIARFLAVCQKGTKVDRPEAWLFRTARNLAIDVVRKRLPSPIGLEALGHIPDDRDNDDDVRFHTRIGELERKDALSWISEIISCLSPRDQAVLRGRYEQGLSCQQVADLEEISLDNAKVRLHRARRRLLRAVELRQLESAQDGGKAR